jgi:SAM-dependent methyltransferase
VQVSPLVRAIAVPPSVGTMPLLPVREFGSTVRTRIGRWNRQWLHLWVSQLGLSINVKWMSRLHRKIRGKQMKNIEKSHTHSGKIQENREAHDAVSHIYHKVHSEIFNNIEQNRISDCLKKIHSMLDKPHMTALDFGCGSGNITNHLLALGFDVTAADISAEFLNIVEKCHADSGKLKIELLSGDISNDLLGQQFDLICVYSVLHHVPDYLGLVKGLAGRLRPNGLLYIDHEASAQYWESRPIYDELQNKCKIRRVIKSSPRVFELRWIYSKLRRIFQPRYQLEGDIHVWADDHIEWEAIKEILIPLQLEEVYSQDYLSYKTYYGEQLFHHYENLTTDMHCSIFRRIN